MNLHYLKCMLMLFSLLIGTQLAVQAQKKAVSGNVINKDTREPLQGVTVKLKGTTRGVVTDAKGFFSITLPDSVNDATLSISHIGYLSQEVRAQIGEPMVVVLSMSNKSMDDVIVVGYGTQKRSNVLGSIAVVSGKEIEDLPTANLSTGLVNIVPGVGVSQASGKPGSTTTVTIRGATTFASGGSTSPLYVIDGLVPIIAGSGSVDPSGKTAFDLLDASQIESITFLKDAAASIYGARGANGVVLVTTKRGRSGKPRVSYSGSYVTEEAAKIPQMIDGYSQALLLNNWVENYKPSNVITTEIYTPAELDSIKAHNGTNTWFNNSWKKDAYAQRHTLSVSGGSDKITFFAGGDYYNEVGNLQNDTHKKYGIQIGTNAKVTDDLTVDLTFSYNTGFNNQPVPKGITTADQTDQENGFIGSLLTTPSFVPETVNGGPVYYAPTKFNPIAFLATGSYAKDNSDQTAINISTTYKIPFIKGLSVRGQYGRNSFNDFTKQWYVPYTANNYASPGVHTNFASAANKATGTQNVIYSNTVSSVQKISNADELLENYSNSVNWQATEGIEYGNIWGKHNFDIALFSEQEQTTGTYLQSYRMQQVIPFVDQYYAYSSNTANWFDNSQNSSTGRVSYLGRLYYTYNNKYMLQAAFRDDASPNFPTNHQWGFFPSVSVGWMASEEPWFQETFKGINDFKVRLNVGLTGNDATGSFLWSQVYTASSPIGYLFGPNGNSPANGLQTSGVPSPDITWERALMKDLGFDGTFGQRKFHFTVDLWYRHGYDMLDPPTASVTNTYGSTINNTNYAILNSWGDEFQLGYNGHVSKDVSVFATVNFGFSIAGNNKVIQQYYNPGTDTGYLYPIGKRTDHGITGYKATGIVRTQADVNAWYAKHPGWLINNDSLRPGDLNFQDIDGDGKITSNDVTQIKKRTNNLFSVGYLFGASWKGLKLAVNISMSVGGTKALSKVDITPPTKDAAGLAMWKNSYTATNTNAPLPAIYAPFANQTSTFWLRSATSMYINNMQLSYTLPQGLINGFKLPEARVYLTGQNLWTLINPTPYRDPRSGEITDYPILRTWTFGLNVNL